MSGQCHIQKESGIIHFVPSTTYKVKEMRRMRAALLETLESHDGTATILFDLQAVDLRPCHVWFTVKTLLRHEEYIKTKVERSAAIIFNNRAAKFLADVFLKAYSPVRPFVVEISRENAMKFLQNDKCAT